MNIAADAIISADETRLITLFNEGAERIFGYDADEVVGRPLEILMPPRVRAKHSGHIEEFAESGQHSRKVAGTSFCPKGADVRQADLLYLAPELQFLATLGHSD